MNSFAHLAYLAARRCFLFALCALLAFGSNAWAQSDDTTSPLLTRFSLNPQNVDVTDSAESVKIEFELFDESAVNNVGRISFDGPNGQTVTSSAPERESITEFGEQFVASVLIPQGASAGNWVAQPFNVSDSVGNSGMVPPEGFGAAGTISVASDPDPDTESPTLSSFFLSPKSVDVTDDGQNVNFEFTLLDETGVSNIGRVSFRGPSGDIVESSLPGPSGSGGGGFEESFFASVEFPQGTEAGNWVAQPFEVSDVLMNRGTVTPVGDSGTVLVVNNADTDIPELISFSLSTQKIDVTTEPQDVNIEITLSDETGLNDVGTVSFRSPSGAFVTSSLPSSGFDAGRREGTYTATVRFPQGVEEGDWIALPFDVSDVLGNKGSVPAEGFGASGTVSVVNDPDDAPPSLTTFSVDPNEINVTAAAQTVDIQFGLSDQTGVNNVERISFVGPTGPPVTSSIPNSFTVSGQFGDLYEATVQFPQGAAAGDWVAQPFDVSDVLMNTGSVTPTGDSGIVLVINDTDTEIPVLTGFDLLPNSVDVTNSAKDVTIQILLADDSRVSSVGPVDLKGPSDQIVTTTPDLTGSNEIEQEFIGQVKLPRGAEAGTWVVQPFAVTDFAMNSGTVSPAGVSGNLTVVNNSDSTPPTLESLSFTPSSIDTTLDSAGVVLRYSVSDDLSGISSGTDMQFVGPGNQTVSAASLEEVSRSGSPEVVTFELSFDFPQFSESGTWRLNGFSLIDNAGNSVDVNPESDGLQFELAVTSDTDSTPPTLESLSFTPGSIDTTLDSAGVVLRYSVSDDLSGISSGTDMQFVGPGNQTVSAASLEEVSRSGSPEVVTFELSFDFPQFSESGTWRLNGFSLIDNAGNSVDVNPESDGLQFELAVTSDTDSTPPTLESLSFTPGSIDTTLDSAGVVLRYSVSDDLSGISSGTDMQFVGPGSQTVSAASLEEVSRSGSPEVVTFELSFDFPQFSESGTWRLNGFSLIDNAGNSVDVNPESDGLQFELIVNSNTDTTPPTLTALSFSPTLIDTAFDSADVVLEFSVTDDISGVEGVSNISFSGPNGQVVGGEEVEISRSGSPETVVYEAVFSFPQLSQSGIWTLNPISAVDKDDNAGSLDPQALGFPNELTVDNTERPSDQQVTMIASEVRVSESAGSVMIQLERFGDTEGTVTAVVVTDPETSEDFQGANADSPIFVTWDTGVGGIQMFPIPITDDTTPEPDESFGVRIIGAFIDFDDDNDAGSIPVVTELTTVVIERNDIPENPIVVEADLQFGPLTVGSSPVSKPLVLINNAPYSFSFVDLPMFSADSLFSIVGGSCTTLPSGLLQGGTSCDFTVQFNPTAVGTTEELLSLELRNSLTGDSNVDLTYTGIVTEVPQPGVLQMAQTELSITESGGTFSLGVVRVGGSDGEVSVNYAFTNGSALAGEDYTGMNGTLTFADGESETQFIEGAVLPDDIEEDNETFTVTLTDANPATALGDDSMLDVVVTIEDEFEAPGQLQFAQESVTVSEDAETVAVVVERVGGSDGIVSVLLDTNAGTATGDADYANTTQMLQWEDGDSDSQTVSIEILGDLLVEDTEIFMVTLSDPQPNDEILGSPAVLTVSITDVPPPIEPGVLQMAQTELTLAESAGEFSLGVVRLGGNDGEISVNYVFTNGSATLDEDYTGMSGTLTFTDGDSETQFIQGMVLPDEFQEDNETFTVTLTEANPATALGDDSMLDVVITIEDEFEPPPELEFGQVQFTQASVTVSEEDEMVEVVVERVNGDDRSLSVLLDTNAGTAIGDEDYVNTTQMLQWEDGDTTSRTVSIGILSDLLIEDTEDFTVTLNDPQPNDQILGTPAVLTVSITDNPPPVEPGVLQLAETELSLTESGGTFRLGVVRLGGNDGQISVDYEFTNGSAIIDEDYIGTNGTLTFADGDSETQFIEGTLLVDQLLEDNETFFVSLSGAVPDEALGDDSMLEATITIVDDSEPPPEFGQVQFSQENVTVNEDDESVAVVVQRVGGSDGILSVMLETNAGTASGDVDFVNTAQMLQWEDGDTSSRTVTIDILSDLLIEDTEDFTVTLNDPQPNTQVLGTPAILTVSITDIPPPLQLGEVRFAQTTLTMTESGGTFSLGVVRVGGTDGEVSVDYAFTNGTATIGEDYTGTNGTLVFSDGDSETQFIQGTVLPDDIEEDSETFTVSLTAAIPAEALGNVAMLDAVITIEDEFEPPPELEFGQIQFAQETMTVSEADESVAVIVERVGGSDGSLSVLLDTNAGTASSGTDYVNTTQMLQWEEGDTSSRTVTIGILSDLLIEDTEAFTVTLNNPQPNAQVLGTPNVLTVSIADVPPPVVLQPGVVRFAQTTLALTESGGTFSLGVVRVGGSDGEISVNYAFTNGSATIGEDYTGMNGTLTFGDGQSETQFITGAVLTDEIQEDSETFTVTLTDATPAAALGNVAMLDVVVTIEDEFEAPPVLEFGQVQFAQESMTVSEDSGSVAVVVQRVGGSDGNISVLLDTNAGTASSGDDYINTTQMLQWSDGDTSSRTVPISILTDLVAEDTESFTVILNNPQPNAQVLGSPNVLTVSITDVAPPVILQPGVVQFANTAISLNEDAGSVTLTVTRSGGSDGSAQVDFNTVAGSAQPDLDFTASAGTLSWVDGETGGKSITIDLLADELEEGLESFTVQLSNPIGSVPGLLLGPADTATVSLMDIEVVINAGVLRFVETETTVAESDGDVVLRVVREGGSDGTASVQYTVEGNTATAGDDFVAQTGELLWMDGETGERTISIEVLQDTQLEEDETFTVTLSDALPSGDAEQLANREAVVTLTDSTEAGELVVSQPTVTVDEASGDVVIAVERRGGTAGSVQLDVTAENGSANAGEDFQLDTSSLVWADGEDGVRQIQLRILDDEQDEPDEQFTIQLSLNDASTTDASRVTLNLSSVEVLIQDNDETTPEDDELTPIPPLADTGSFRLRVIGGDNQIANPGDEISPIVIEVFDTSNGDSPVPTIPVRWRAIPEGSLEFIDGTEGIADDEGRISFRVRVVERGFNTLIASIDTAALASRMLPSDVVLGENEVAITVRGGLVASAGLRNNQTRTADALDEVCEVLGVRIEGGENVTAEQQDLFNTCAEIRVQLDDPQLGASLDRLSGEELFALDDSIIQINDIQITNVYSRLNAVRSGRAEVLDVSGLQLQIYDQNIPGSVVNAAQNALSGGSASADNFSDSRLGVFVNGTLSFGEVTDDGRQRGGDLESRGITVGMDYRATNQTVFGAGFGVTNTTTDFSGDEGDSEVNALNVTFYGTWFEPKKGYVDGVLELGRNEYDATRRVNLPGSVDQFATGSTNADVVSLTLGVGRDFSKGSWEFGPYGRASIVRAKVDAFSETTTETVPGFGSALDYASRRISSATLSVGGQVTRTVNTKRAILLPQLRVEVETESQRTKDPITAVFQNDPSSTSFQIDGSKRDSAHLNIGVGSSFILKGGHSGYLFYEKQVRNSLIDQHWLKLGFRLEF